MVKATVFRFSAWIACVLVCQLWLRLGQLNHVQRLDAIIEDVGDDGSNSNP